MGALPADTAQLVLESGTSVASLAPGNYRTIARGAGLTPQHVSRVLRGLKGASLFVAARIARAADVTLDALYTHIMAQPDLTIAHRRTLADSATGAPPARTRRTSARKGVTRRRGRTARH